MYIIILLLLSYALLIWSVLLVLSYIFNSVPYIFKKDQIKKH